MASMDKSQERNTGEKVELFANVKSLGGYFCLTNLSTINICT